MNTERLKEVLNQARHETGKVIIGQRDVIDKALIAIFTGSHALIEGVPGVAKTLLVRALAKILGAPFSRIQFTPDLMPSDITGTNVYQIQRGEFALAKGPVFTTFLLADEVNRAPAKTQSALLQAMQERSVTIDGVVHALSPHFTVFATQNPVEFEGTYPLPEAQKDRFMFLIRMGYPSLAEERELARAVLDPEPPEARLARLEPVLTEASLESARRGMAALTLRSELADYAVDITRATRLEESVLVGAGPRATQALLLGARSLAVLRGRDFVTPDDIKEAAWAALEHRLVLRPEFELEQVGPAEVVAQVLEKVPVPR
ncbi:MAG TPA: MoxR family ATPase [bacterium]|nr:MoxR family ATPase [bacterium]